MTETYTRSDGARFQLYLPDTGSIRWWLINPFAEEHHVNSREQAIEEINKCDAREEFRKAVRNEWAWEDENDEPEDDRDPDTHEADDYVDRYLGDRQW
jgi:hypothetical protein